MIFLTQNLKYKQIYLELKNVPFYYFILDIVSYDLMKGFKIILFIIHFNNVLPFFYFKTKIEGFFYKRIVLM